MSRNYGKFKMRTAENTAFADRLRDLVDALEGEEVVAVYEYSSITSKYKPNKSAYKWLCEKRGQEIAEEEKQQQPDTNARIFAEMRELMTEMEYTPDERKKAIDMFVGNLPIKGCMKNSRMGF